MSPPLPPESRLATHDVTNQPAAPGDRDLWSEDRPLREAIAVNGGDVLHLATHGRALGTADLAEAGRVANRCTPELRLFDRAGRRLDEVSFHPAYHRFLGLGLTAGYAALPWQGASGGHVTHAAMVYLHSQVEPGTCCPMTMTYAAAALLRADPDLARDWLPKISSATYDPAVMPLADKRGVTLGMAMTEKQGGSDLRANATRAERDGDGWRLTGHKWFCSAPMSDAFLTLAQTPKGLTCFLVPRWLPGERNALRLMRLKDKLGNRASASAEIEYDRAFATRVGDEGRGIPTIIEMVHHTRLDTAVAPAGLMRAALAEAHRWVSHRTAFQRRLIDQPLMRMVLADLALDWLGATALGLRVARAFDGTSEEDRTLARIAVALAKFLANKRCVTVVAEAMEVLGGMGYVEDTPLPLLYREAPLNGIWEGSGNVICLDILRTLAKEPRADDSLAAELAIARGQSRAYDTALADTRARWPGPPPEAEARAFAERTALLLTASVLIRQSPEIGAAYATARLSPQGFSPGTAPLDPDPILARLSAAE
ncbi:MAG: acyl-CoA dehydrogenase family protein [Paracoccaceae bacterium]